MISDIAITPVQTADEIRHQIVKTFELFEPHLNSYHEYAVRVAALSQEYHVARFKDAFPELKVEERVLIGTLDARETPKTLDTRLAELRDAGITPKLVIFDRSKSTYHLFL